MRAFHKPGRYIPVDPKPFSNQRPTSGQRDKMVAFRMTAEGYDSIRLAAHEERISVSAYVVQAINLMRKKKGQEPVS